MAEQTTLTAPARAAWPTVEAGNSKSEPSFRTRTETGREGDYSDKSHDDSVEPTLLDIRPAPFDSKTIKGPVDAEVKARERAYDDAQRLASSAKFSLCSIKPSVTAMTKKAFQAAEIEIGFRKKHCPEYLPSPALVHAGVAVPVETPTVASSTGLTVERTRLLLLPFSLCLLVLIVSSGALFAAVLSGNVAVLASVTSVFGVVALAVARCFQIQIRLAYSGGNSQVTNRSRGVMESLLSRFLGDRQEE